MKTPGMLVLLATALLSGCIEEKIARRAAADHTLADATASRLSHGRVCCASYRAMPFNRFVPGMRQPVSLDASSPIYDFTFGRSRFVAYTLPALGAGDELVVGATELYSGSSARPRFRPAVIFLSETYEPLPVQPYLALNDHFMGWSTEGHAAHIPLTPGYSAARYVIIAADPGFIGSSYIEKRHSTTMPAGGAYISMSIPEQQFPYGYEGKGFLEIRHASR
jgi:hypothetical protein